MFRARTIWWSRSAIGSRPVLSRVATGLRRPEIDVKLVTWWQQQCKHHNIQSNNYSHSTIHLRASSSPSRPDRMTQSTTAVDRSALVCCRQFGGLLPLAIRGAQRSKAEFLDYEKCQQCKSSIWIDFFHQRRISPAANLPWVSIDPDVPC